MLGNYDRVVIARKPDGTPIHTTRATLREYGYEAVRAEALKLIADESGLPPKCPPMDSYIVAQQGPQPGIGALTPDGVDLPRGGEQ